MFIKINNNYKNKIYNIIMQSYYEKYLKYKNKYTTLKNQKGGLMGGSSDEKKHPKKI